MVGWTSSTNGRSATRPRWTASSAAATSRIVPPRWTVPARAVCGSRHGIGPSSAQSSLNTPGPYRKPSSRRRYPAGRRSPATSSTCRGVRSSSTARAGGSSRASRSAGRSRSRRPAPRASASRAAAIAPAPAAGQRPADRMGEQPEHEPERRRRRRVRGGSIEWAAMPANRARAAGSRKASRARAVAGSSAGSPKRAIRIGWRGGRTTGRRSSARSRSHSLASGPNSRPRRRRRGPGPRRSAAPDRGRARGRPLRPGVSAWATGDLGVHPLEPVAREVEGPEERRREAQRMGRRARRRGRTRAASARRSASRHRPCPRPRRSRTERPARASSIAAASPLGPPPTTIASSASSRRSTGHVGRSRTGSAGARRRRTQRTGAVTVPTAMLTAALWRTLPAYLPLAAPVDAHRLRRSTTGSRTPSDRREVLERPLPEPVVGPVRAEHVASAR